MDGEVGDDTIDVHLVLAPEHRTAPAAVDELVARSQSTLRRMFPGVVDDPLERYWLIAVRPAEAEALIGRLLALPGVEGAYIPPNPSPA